VNHHGPLVAGENGRDSVLELPSGASSPTLSQELLNHWVAFDDVATHTVAMNLRVARQIGIYAQASPVVSWSAQDEESAAIVLSSLRPGARFAVLHVSPKYAYKTWTAQGWHELAQWLHSRDMIVLIAGGGSTEELQFIDSLLPGFPENTVNLAGRAGLGALACLLSRAALYVGTDTAVTHMAAALNIPTVALFGPSNPVKWGPWPHDFDGDSSPWEMCGSGRVGNVYLVQGQKHCVPCRLEGCDRHIASLSDCLQEIPASRVVAAAELLLAMPEEPGVQAQTS